MSQLFIAVNVDRREFIEAHSFGDGLEFGEFCGSSNGFLAGLAHLLRSGGEPSSADAVVGSWAGCRLAIVCDDERSGLKERAYDEAFKNVSLDVIRAMVRNPAMKSALDAKTRWRRVEGYGALFADSHERDFYQAVFGEMGRTV